MLKKQLLARRKGLWQAANIYIYNIIMDGAPIRQRFIFKRKTTERITTRRLLSITIYDTIAVVTHIDGVMCDLRKFAFFLHKV